MVGMFCDISLHIVDPDGFIHLIPAAIQLALAHTNPPTDHRQGVFLLYQPQRIFVESEPCEAHVSLHVHSGGTVSLSRAETVRIMVGEEEFEGGFAGMVDTLASSGYLHPVPDAGGAGGHQSPGAFYLDDAKETRAEKLELRVMAKGGNIVQGLFAGEIEDGLARAAFYRLPVDGQFHR